MSFPKKGVRRKAAPTSADRGIAEGYRSGLEEKIADQLRVAGVVVEFESIRLPYVKPVKPQTYTPDFPLPNGIIVESKGRFVTADRQKHIAVKAAHPDADIRFVFSRSKATISKTSKTTYADWCIKHGFQFADKTIPMDWLAEEVNHASLAVIEKFRKAFKK
jgi:hypothetical protein